MGGSTIGYLVLTVVISPLVGGVFVYYFQSRVRVREQRETAGIQAEAAISTSPLQMMQQQLQVKDAQIAQAAQTHDAFVESAMARNDATTKAILELAEQFRVQTSNLKDLGSLLQSHRDEDGSRAGRIYDQIGKVNERLAGLEASVRSTLEVAKDAVSTAKDAAETAERVAREARA